MECTKWEEEFVIVMPDRVKSIIRDSNGELKLYKFRSPNKRGESGWNFRVHDKALCIPHTVNDVEFQSFMRLTNYFAFESDNHRMSVHSYLGDFIGKREVFASFLSVRSRFQPQAQVTLELASILARLRMYNYVTLGPPNHILSVFPLDLLRKRLCQSHGRCFDDLNCQRCLRLFQGLLPRCFEQQQDPRKSLLLLNRDLFYGDWHRLGDDGFYDSPLTTFFALLINGVRLKYYATRKNHRSILALEN